MKLDRQLVLNQPKRKQYYWASLGLILVSAAGYFAGVIAMGPKVFSLSVMVVMFLGVWYVQRWAFALLWAWFGLTVFALLGGMTFSVFGDDNLVTKAILSVVLSLLAAILFRRVVYRSELPANPSQTTEST